MRALREYPVGCGLSLASLCLRSDAVFSCFPVPSADPCLRATHRQAPLAERYAASIPRGSIPRLPLAYPYPDPPPAPLPPSPPACLYLMPSSLLPKVVDDTIFYPPAQWDRYSLPVPGYENASSGIPTSPAWAGSVLPGGMPRASEGIPGWDKGYGNAICGQVGLRKL